MLSIFFLALRFIVCQALSYLITQVLTTCHKKFTKLSSKSVVFASIKIDQSIYGPSRGSQKTCKNPSPGDSFTQRQEILFQYHMKLNEVPLPCLVFLFKRASLNLI